MAESVKYLIEKRDPKMNTNTYYILYRIMYIIIPLGHLCSTQTKTQHRYLQFYVTRRVFTDAIISL